MTVLIYVRDVRRVRWGLRRYLEWIGGWRERMRGKALCGGAPDFGIPWPGSDIEVHYGDDGDEAN